MATGMEMMMGALVKSLGLDPEEIKKKAGEIGELLSSLKAQLDRIEASMTTIEGRLSHGTEHRNGAGNGSGSAGNGSGNESEPKPGGRA